MNFLVHTPGAVLRFGAGFAQAGRQWDERGDQEGCAPGLVPTAKAARHE
jgi:hypothetical protein